MGCGTYADIVIEWLRRKEGIVGPVSEVSTEAFSPIRGHDAPSPSMNQTHSKPAWIFFATSYLQQYTNSPCTTKYDSEGCGTYTFFRRRNLTHARGFNKSELAGIHTYNRSLTHIQSISHTHTPYLKTQYLQQMQHLYQGEFKEGQMSGVWAHCNRYTHTSGAFGSPFTAVLWCACQGALIDILGH